MFRRSLFFVVFVTVALACAASPALALGVLWSQPVGAGAQLATASRGPIVVTEVAGGGGTTSLVATQYPREGGASLTSHTLVPDAAGLDDWHVVGDGAGNVTVVWRAAGAVHATRVDLSTGSTHYGPVVVCSDAAAGAAVALSGIAGDASGGVYVWCTASPTRSTGDTLLNYISATGVPARQDPGLAVKNGSVKALAVGSDAHAFALLGSPGRNGLAVQRFAADLATTWASPISTYGPFEQPSAAAQVPIDITAAATATVAWREGPKVRLQRFSSQGLLWLHTVGLTMADPVKLTSDGLSGVYVAGPSGGGIVVRHILASGVEAPGSPSALPVLGLSQPRVEAISVNRAGDLTVASRDAAVPPVGMPAISQMTSLGMWKAAPLAGAPESFTAAAQDGAGGVYVLGGGGAAALLHLGDAGTTVSFRPRAALIDYGRAMTVTGYVTTDGEPLTGRRVVLRETRGGVTRVRGITTTDAIEGFYQTTVAPRANGTWEATSAGAASSPVVVRVMPNVTLTLSHLKSGARLTEILSGTVAPLHAGKRLLVQTSTASGWRTVAAGRLDGRSRYSVRWLLPYRTATYRVRTVIRAHGDHAEGVSPTATIRVVVEKG